MKLYFVESATGYNYVMAETDDGILCSNCAPDGKWGSVDLNGPGVNIAEIKTRIYQETAPDLDETDLCWMGDPCYSSMAEWDEEQDELESWQQDRRHFIGEFPRNHDMDESMMVSMVRDWLADNADEMADLELDGDPYYDDDLSAWVQDAHDETADYSLIAEDGSVRVEYVGSR